MSRTPLPPRLALVLLAGLALAALPGLSRLSLDSSPEVFFLRDAERLEEYRRLVDTFGPLESLRVVVHGVEVGSPEGLAYLGALEETARSTPGVREAAGLAGRYRWLSSSWPPDDPPELLRRAIDDPLVRGAGWIDPAGAVATVDLWLEPGEETVPAALEARLAAVPAPPGASLELIGLPVVQRAIDDSMRRLVGRNLPILALGIVALLLWGLGHPRHALPPILFVSVVVGGVLGAMGLIGVRLNLVTVVLVPIVVVICVATAVHLQHTFIDRRHRGESPAAAVRSTVRRRGPAVVGAALTTAAAFGSFALSPVPPIRTLGIWLAAASLWMLAAAWLFYPALLLTLSGSGQPPRQRHGFRAAGLVGVALGRPRTTIALFALAAALFAGGATRVRQQSGLLSYFSESSPVRRAIERADGAGLGAVTAELVLRLDAPADGSFRDPRRLARLADLGDRLRRIPDLRGAVGAGDLFVAGLDEVVVEGEPTPAVRWLVLGLLQSADESARLLDSYLGDGGRATRLTLSLPLAGHRRLEPALEDARALAREAFPEARVAVTGEMPLILAVERRLLGTLASSLAVTVGVVALLLLVLLRSLDRTVRVLLPNLWPLAALFGAMGWLGIALDSATVMSAAVVLGLSVDDTLHTLAEITAIDDSAGRGPAAAVEAAAKGLAPAQLLTSMVLLLGFGVCAVSDLAQNARFCVLVGIGCLAALVADLGLLPVLLSRRRSAGPGRGLG